ncbi:MAG TPA: PEP-CTERM sorting domain-containing protein [Bryobacteraceae bacterium]|nr:PEP-CTERM sorting domain-containing protein [Bryobacteraceae bacterium]
MKLIKNLAITGSLGLIAFAGLAGASTLSLDTSVPTTNGYYNGTGNNTGTFTVVTSDDGSLQLALKADTAFVAPTLVPDAGTTNYQAATTTTTRFGETVATWDYYFSIDTNANGNGADLSAYDYSLTVIDETLGQTVQYDPTSLIDSASMGAGNVVTSGNTNQSNGGVNLTTQFSMQNAENVGFQLVGWGPNWNSAGQPQATDAYAIQLQILDKQTGATVLSDSIGINTPGVPEPGTIVTMLGSLGALGLFVRRRKA